MFTVDEVEHTHKTHVAIIIGRPMYNLAFAMLNMKNKHKQLQT